MTRYARAGKGTHNRVEKESTSWNELKPPEPERVRGVNGTEKVRKFSSEKKSKERFSKRRKTGNEVDSSDRSEQSEQMPTVGMNRKSDGSKGKFKNANIRGFGQSKSVKIFGQFWVPFEDGKRLKSLLKKLRAQGMPRKQILDVLQNERRKAEKAAKRQRDKTCFQCRQFGHILSDCPNLKNAVVGGVMESVGDSGALDGASEQGLLCYKCGSTEHSSRNCRRKGEKFEFAKCFICSGSGHIARQCPKNTNGIYPSGGSCSECGSTAHLKKDCPDLVIESNFSAKEETDAVTLRMSDPYSSMEYEPVYAHENEVNDKEDDNTSPANDREENLKEAESKEARTKPKMFNKKGKHGKRQYSDKNSTSVTEFNFGNNEVVPAKKKQLFANPTKKIVKF